MLPPSGEGPPADPGASGGPATRRGKAAVWAAAVVFGLVVAGGATVVYGQFGPADATGQIRTYVVESDSAIRIAFTVTKAPDKEAACLIRSRGEDLGEAGHTVVRVPRSTKGKRVVLVEHVLVTTSRAVTGEVIRCKALVPGQALPGHTGAEPTAAPHHARG